MPQFGENTQVGFAPAKFLDFLGRGIDTPFRRGSSDFAVSEGVAHVRSMISNVLGTRSDSEFTQGELPWRTDFGTLLHHLRHRNNNLVTSELARVYVAEALARWVPQVIFRDVEIATGDGPNGEETILHIRVLYDIVRINRQGNQVVLPDVTQVVTV